MDKGKCIKEIQETRNNPRKGKVSVIILRDLEGTLIEDEQQFHQIINHFLRVLSTVGIIHRENKNIIIWVLGNIIWVVSTVLLFLVS